MLERKITSEFARVAAAIEPPAGLYPAERIRRVSPRRRRLGSGVGPVTGFGLAAALLAAALFLWPRVEQPAATAGAAGAVEQPKFSLIGFPAVESMEPGQVIDNPKQYPEHGIFPRQRGTAYTVEQLAARGWPVPSYLGPASDHKALVVETFDPLREDRIWWTDLRLQWSTEAGAVTFNPIRPPAGGSAPDSPYESMARTKDPTYGYDYVPVTVKGVPAWGIRDPLPGIWVLIWRVNGTRGYLSSRELPLEELVKIAESLPSLQ